MLLGLLVIQANVALTNIPIALWALKAERSRAGTCQLDDLEKLQEPL